MKPPSFLPETGLPSSRARLERDVRRLAVPRHPETSPQALADAENFVALELGAAGLRVERHLFTHRRREFHNVVGTLDGSDPARPMLVIGAHFDTAGHTPGADDNASAVAAMLEIARVLRGWKPAAEVRFVGFNLEEIQRDLGSRLGSRAWARHLVREGRPVAGALVLEMVGYTGPRQAVPLAVRLARRIPAGGSFLAAAGDWRSRALLRRFERAAKDVIPLVTLAVPFKGWLVPQTRMSDNARFWDEGIPSLMVTDTAFLRNPNYHRASDTPETLDYDFLARVVETVRRAVVDIAG